MTTPSDARPRVSVLVSAYNAERFIQGALESLEQQTIAQHLEIIVIDSGSVQNEHAVVKQFQERYGNIQYVRTERETIYQAWNRGIRIARGRYVTNANCDDRHRSDALEVLARCLDDHPDVALVYADSVVTFQENQTFDEVLPDGYHFRPEYKPEIMLTGCHMGPQPMWRRSIHEEIGYFREDLRSAGDYEFWCRMALRYGLMHVPQTLCLYFENPEGICNSDKALSASEASAVAKHYHGFFPETSLEPALFTRIRPKEGVPFVNIGMVTFNRLEFTRQAIASVIKYTDFPFVLTVIDNASTDGSREYLQKLHSEGLIDNLHLLPENVGVAKASNLAWHQEPAASYYLKLDNDIVLGKPGWLGKMVNVIDQTPGIGVIAYNFEPTSYPVAQVGNVLVRVKPQGNLGGACLLVPRRTWELLGDWCEDYGLYGEEDRDYGFRVSLAGLLNAYMDDEDIGLHLPAGKAAVISPWTLTATDGLEEHNESEYRHWKDQRRDEHLKWFGIWERNQFAYSNGQKPLHLSSEFVASRSGLFDSSGQTGPGFGKVVSLFMWLTFKRLVSFWKMAGRVLQAAGQSLQGAGLFSALASGVQSIRHGGLAALRTKALYFLNQTTNYAKWVSRYDRLSEEDRRQIAGHIASLSYHPVFSVLMPVYKPIPEHLAQAIQSVITQLYPHWELCITDDASDESKITSLIEHFCEQDKRIKFVQRTQRGHISAASNSCLELAGGDFVALLDHDDLLAPHALYMAARVLSQQPDLSLIYSDEDKISAGGIRTWPHFKSDWNVDLMRSQNAVNHLGIYRTEVVREIGGFRLGVEGCQDWDLALRVSERISGAQILHLPYVLYHWRITSQSTALNTNPKGYVVEAGKRVLADHLERVGEGATVVPQYGAYFRVQYQLNNPPSVAVISQTATLPVLERLVHCLALETDYPNLSLYLLTDSEQRGLLSSIVSKAQSLQLKLILFDCEIGTTHAQRINHAIAGDIQPVVCLLDPECVPSGAGWLTELVSQAMRPAIGAAGAKMIHPDGTVRSAGTILGLGQDRVAGAAYAGVPKEERGAAGRAALIQNYSAVSAACMVVRLEVLAAAKGFDLELPLANFGEVDFCLRLGQLGYRVVWTPFAELVWHGSVDEPINNLVAVKVMRSRWKNMLNSDHAYNPNLSLDNSFPMLAPAPRVPHCSAYCSESART